MPGIKGTMREYKHGTLHSGSKNGPKVKSRAQAIAIGLSEDRKMGKGKMPAKKMKGGKSNTKMDMGLAGERATRDEQPMVPPGETDGHTGRQPHPMNTYEMYGQPSQQAVKALEPDIAHHMKQAAMHGGKGEEHRAMREHHEGMARALRAQLHPKAHHGPEYP